MIYQIYIAGELVSEPSVTSAEHQRLADLRAKGWTLRPAAKHLGVNFTHLHRVLTGERHSASLLRKIETLPARHP